MDFIQIAALTSVAVAIATFAARFMVTPKRSSPTPEVFDLEIPDAYKRILKLLSHKSVGAHNWKILSEMENQYIIAELMYNEPLALQAKGVLHFDFKEIAKKKTTVRWSCEWDPLTDIVMAQKVERLTDSWLRTGLTDSRNLMEPIKFLSEFETKLPQDSTYDRLFKRLSARSDGATVWTVTQFTAPSNISTEVRTIALHKQEVTCSAKLDFVLTRVEKLTKIHCSYEFEPKYPMETILALRQITDDWIKLVVWTS
ncbi:MAG: hypothetical protein JST89_17845 [Cyanobacteria bacterium SZAS-4]|nr:hypothetical protein [Cyanobacteria bacterium SZAS-4]